jgi:tetratricopeptide (TPR) repeat protein
MTRDLLPTWQPPTRERLGSAGALPPVGLVGSLEEAWRWFRANQMEAAWKATADALRVRPFHPEAFWMLGVIAWRCGAPGAAVLCAQCAAQLAPAWEPARELHQAFLQLEARTPQERRGAEGAGCTAPIKASPFSEGMPACADDHPFRGGLIASAQRVLASASGDPRLSVCMITRNEERFLGQCLLSLRGMAQQVVLVDTGSTDRTVAIAGQHGAEVYHFAWCDDFSAARNVALEHATGDWILVLDADEELPPESHAPLRSAMQAANVIAYRLPIVDAGKQARGCNYVPRLFRNAPGLFFQGRIHEHPFRSIEAKRKAWGLKNLLGDVLLRHHGYTSEVTAMRGKVERNRVLLERALQESPDDPSLLMSYGLELVRSGSLAAGILQEQKACRHLAEQPPEEVPAELRAMLLRQLSSHLLAASRFSEVISLLASPLATAEERSASLHFALGLAWYQTGEWARCEDAMRDCVAKRGHPELAPDNERIHGAGPHHCRALALARLGRPTEAEQAFRAALADEPSATGVRSDFAVLLHRHGRSGEALQLLHQGLTLSTASDALWELGATIALSRPELLEFAKEWTAEARRQLPKNRTILARHAEALLLSSDARGALPLWVELADAGDASALAARLLCEVTCGVEPVLPAAALDEAQISRHFLSWYRRLLAANARAVVLRVHAGLPTVQRLLPTVARALTSALAEANAA